MQFFWLLHNLSEITLYVYTNEGFTRIAITWKTGKKHTSIIFNIFSTNSLLLENPPRKHEISRRTKDSRSLWNLSASVSERVSSRKVLDNVSSEEPSEIVFRSSYFELISSLDERERERKETDSEKKLMITLMKRKTDKSRYASFPDLLVDVWERFIYTGGPLDDSLSICHEED